MMTRLMMAVVVCILFTGGASKPKVLVRFHGQGGATEGAQFSRPVQMMGSNKPVYMQTMPLVTERDIVSMHPFPASDGTFGVYFKLDAHGRNLLAQHTMAHRDTYIFATVNARRVIDLYIDKGVEDGIVTIPRGLTEYEIALLESSFPPFGSEGSKPTKKRPKALEEPPLEEVRGSAAEAAGS